jgi:hypothetical protein
MMVFLRNDLRDRALGLNGYDLEEFRVNVKGHKNLAGTDVESSIYEHLRLMAKNVILTDTPRLTGAWTQEPVFSDGTPRLDDASLDQAAEDALSLSVVPSGPDAARWLTGEMTVDQFFTDICPSGKMKVGIKPNGQMVVCVHNPDADPVVELDEGLEIIARSFAFEATDQGFANATPYRYAGAHDAFGNLEFQDGATEEHAVSQSPARYDERLEDRVFDFAWRRGAGAARQLARAFLAESAYLPQPAQADSVLHWLHRSPGEVVSVTHRQGATESGYTQRKHAVLGMRISLEDYRVGLTLLDLGTQVGQLSFFQYEDFMAGRWIGGSRHETCLTVSTVVVPYNYHAFVVDWDEIPGTHGLRARILVATAAGNLKPSIFLDGEDPAADTSVVEGTDHTSATWAEQLLVIPRGSGEVRYWMLPILSGGATDADAQMFGVVEGYRL